MEQMERCRYLMVHSRGSAGAAIAAIAPQAVCVAGHGLRHASDAFVGPDTCLQERIVGYAPANRVVFDIELGVGRVDDSIPTTELLVRSCSASCVCFTCCR